MIAWLRAPSIGRSCYLIDSRGWQVNCLLHIGN
jgi:hypothetical protein